MNGPWPSTTPTFGGPRPRTALLETTEMDSTSSENKSWPGSASARASVRAGNRECIDWVPEFPHEVLVRLSQGRVLSQDGLADLNEEPACGSAGVGG